MPDTRKTAGVRETHCGGGVTECTEEIQRRGLVLEYDERESDRDCFLQIITSSVLHLVREEN
jgi:hypothetical protein